MSDDKNPRPKGHECAGSDSIVYIAAHWHRLPPHIREAIVTLIDAGVEQSINTKSQALGESR